MKTSLLLSLTVAAALFTGPVHAQVFKCKGPNGVVYQDGPCEGGAAVDTRSASGVKGARAPSDSGGSRGSGAVSTKPTHPVLPEKMRR
jgi:hypothetical protein